MNPFQGAGQGSAFAKHAVKNTGLWKYLRPFSEVTIRALGKKVKNIVVLGALPASFPHPYSTFYGFLLTKLIIRGKRVENHYA